MFWVIATIVVALIAVGLKSVLEKIVVGATVIAVGLLLLKWITGVALFITLVKVCAALIVITIVATILLALMG